MRPIKFRAWDENSSTMDMNPGIDVDWCRVSVNSILDKSFKGDNELVNDYQFMQYTGLKDKNGVEIYEGDIVAHPDKTEGFTVEYCELFDNEQGGSLGIGFDLNMNDAKGMVVIGNIYEDQDLIK